MSTHLVNKLYSRDLIKGLPKVEAYLDEVCEDYVKGKQHRVSFKSKKVISTMKPLELVHIDFYGPTWARSLKHSRYVLVIVDDYSRYTWTVFFKRKDETFREFEALMKKTRRRLGH